MYSRCAYVINFQMETARLLNVSLGSVLMQMYIGHVCDGCRPSCARILESLLSLHTAAKIFELARNAQLLSARPYQD